MGVGLSLGVNAVQKGLAEAVSHATRGQSLSDVEHLAPNDAFKAMARGVAGEDKIAGRALEQFVGASRSEQQMIVQVAYDNASPQAFEGFAAAVHFAKSRNIA